jgi:acetolactate synthase-1/2/3 large subunit
VGQVASDQEEREAFQEIDYRRMFGPMSKWVAQIDRTDRIPEYVARAYATACSGRPGPVVLALPEDMLARESDAADAPPYRAVRAHPGADDIAAVHDLVAGAERPLAILGGAGWTAKATSDLTSFVEENAIPAAAAFRRQDTLDNDSPSYAGDVGIGVNPALAARVREADVILAIAPRLGEITTSGYTLLEPPTPRQTLVHVHPGPEELGRVYRAALPILAGPEEFAAAVRDVRIEPRWRGWTEAARADYEAWQVHGPLPGALDLGECIAHLRRRLPDATVTNGAGNFSVWVHRFWRWHSFGTQLAPTSGAMGYGVPAALAAKSLEPGRTVVCFAGDGDFLMSGQELATARQYDLPVLVVVVDNGMFGTIRMHQERMFPGRVVGTDLVNPDFAAFARSFGAFGENVERTEDFPAALERALEAGTAAVLALRLDPEAITPRTTLSALRAGG